MRCRRAGSSRFRFTAYSAAGRSLPALRGALPGVFALPAGIGDVLTGLFAVPAAIAVATGTAQGRRAAIVWNIFGLADFAVAITLGLITSPGRVPADRSGCVEHRRRRLSGCADPCFRGAKLDPAARAVAAPTTPAQQGGGGAALDARRGEAGRKVCQEGLAHVVPPGEREAVHIKQQEHPIVQKPVPQI